MTLRTHIVFIVAGIAAAAACSESSAPSPFVGAQAMAGAAGMEAGPVRAPLLNREPTIGGPCSEDAQCDDKVPCTKDRCDRELGRCRFVPDDFSCLDATYCNGSEYCDNTLGCREGAPVSCSDNDTCTIDLCVEASRSCEHTPRDADGDGDPDWHCGGSDCDDTNPAINSKATEICDNQRDDNCDGQVDEPTCARAKNDTCADPLLIQASGTYQATLAAAKSDYALSCGTTEVGSDTVKRPLRDIVVAIQVPEGAAQDVDIVATSEHAELKLGASKVCGDLQTETRCVGSFPWSQAGTVARTQLLNLAPGVHPLYVFSTLDEPVFLDIKYSAVSAPATNEDCARAKPLLAGVPQTAKLVDVGSALASQCGAEGAKPALLPAGDLVYEFDLTEPRDVHLFAVSNDTWGVPIISLRDSKCLSSAEMESESELTCRVGNNNELLVRGLGAGRYFVAVSALGPSEVSVALELGAPTAAPLDNTCETAPLLQPNQPQSIALQGHVDAVKSSCLSGAVDASYALKLGARSDVLLVAQSADNDVTGVALFDGTCSASGEVSCRSASLSPLRLGLSDVPKGEYRVAVESLLGSSVTLTPWIRNAVPPSAVPNSDDCGAPFLIPPTGGMFYGNTANANADYDASCDFGSLLKGGAGDQLLKLSLSERSRVVIDADRSGYPVLLDLRKGPDCPGAEVPEGCAVSAQIRNTAFLAFLDLTLDPGDYFLQVDGYSGAVGPWAVNVFVAKAP